MTTVRTRFPPSPTGHLHIGGARTALFNYLFARHHDGQFVLRIEDTDRERSTEESVRGILEGMTWLGLDWDEGPFFQSQRYEIYTEHAERLLKEGRLYRCFCKPEELEAKRKEALAAGRSPMYDRTCRRRTDVVAGMPFTLRFMAPIDGATTVPDLVKGVVNFDNRELDDLIVVRSDGTPTYNLCAVVDDALMRITHVIRGEDHLTNTPKQIQLYRALGFDEPRFAHIPLIMGLDRSRLSKRHGATSLLAYRDMGYLPHALVNYLVRLGWSFGDQEIFSRQELIEKFSLENVGTSAAIYNLEKAEWLNFHYLKAMPAEELAEAAKPFLLAKGYRLPGDEWLRRMVRTLQERAKTLVELADQAHFYLRDDIEIDGEAAAKHLKPAIKQPLRELRDRLAGVGTWNEEAIHACFTEITERSGLKLGKIAQPVRVAVTGGPASPGIFEVLDLLGKERSVVRLDKALALITDEAPGAERP
jgi:glutamyl-tRNA synthetase